MKCKCFLVTVIMLISVSAAITPSIAKADIHVYDKNNQYLGILLTLTSGYLLVFLPSLGASWSIEYDSVVGCDHVVFDSQNCSGTPYSLQYEPLPGIVDISGSAIGGFYISDYNGKRTFTPGSYYDYNCQCQQSPPYGNGEYYPLTQVQMPFTIPIALPLSFNVETQTEVKKAVVIPLMD